MQLYTSGVHNRPLIVLLPAFFLPCDFPDPCGGIDSMPPTSDVPAYADYKLAADDESTGQVLQYINVALNVLPQSVKRTGPSPRTFSGRPSASFTPTQAVLGSNP